MTSSDQLAAHALDLFGGLGPGVVARRMFGGLGFYAAGRFFAIGDPDDGRLYLKVDDETRAAFEAAGGTPFVYRGPRGEEMSMGYLTPPDGALDDPEEMLPWARLAVEAAGRAAARKAAKPATRKAGGAKKGKAKVASATAKRRPTPRR